MRRLLLCVSLSLLLCACAKREALPTAEVLQRTAAASQQLQSSRFTVKGEGTGASYDANVSLEGILQDGGAQLQFTLQTTGEVAAEKQHTFAADVDAVIAIGEDAYVRIRSLNISPPHPKLDPRLFTLFLQRWWKIPLQRTPFPPTAITPDPRFLYAQSQVITVTEDRGIKRVEGKDTYVYDVTLDREKLVAFLEQVAEERGEPFNREETIASLAPYTVDGTLWIDADTFFIQRLTWTIASEGVGDPFQGTVDAVFREHNIAPRIEIPSDAQLLSPALLNGVPGAAPYDETFNQGFPLPGGNAYEDGSSTDLFDALQGLKPPNPSLPPQ
ncbi:MAG: hypothetical protein Q7R81_01085 [Candidatus Peregrinibacteria bacterium]|nr:hypothetical protein [Candidatus Peregrinibacteria bacterium]